VAKKKRKASPKTEGFTRSRGLERLETGADPVNADLGTKIFEHACNLHQQQKFDAAEEHYRQALKQNPNLVDAWRNLGAMLRGKGKVEEGLHCTQEAIRQRPEDGSLWGNAGNALRDLGRLDESKRAFEKARELSPNDLGALLGLAITLNRASDYWGVVHNVLPKLDEQRKPNPTASDLLLEVGNAYHYLDQPEQALKHWQKAMALAEGEKQIMMVLNTAQVLCEHRQYGNAEALLVKQLKLHTKNANLHYALGVAVKGQGRWEEACERFEASLELNPGYAICLNTYGLLLRDLGRSHQARECFEKALAIDPAFGAAMNNLGSVLKDVARYPEALKWLRKGCEALADNPAAHSNVLFTLVGYELEPAKQRLEEAEKFAEKFATSPFERWKDRIPHPDQNRRLRMGLLSPDFCRHAVSYFIEPLLEKWDRKQLEITLYSCGAVNDDYTKRLQGKSDRWRDIHGVTDENACLQILRDEIDILIDLAGHTAGNRLTLMAKKPAPIQATYLGYYGTTGLRQIDYWITDRTLHPPELDNEDPCSEQRWRLNRPYVTFRPLPEAPEVGDLPMLKRGYPMFGSFNQSRKITQGTAKRWMEVLDAVPEAHLMLKSKNLGEDTEETRIRELFSKLGLASERLHLLAHSPSVAAHLECYRYLDLALDTEPYTGCTTTADALWMGVPVLTVSGKSMVSRQAAAVLVAAGHPEWISYNTDELINISKQLLSKPEKLKEIRGNLRNELRRSQLINHQELATELEAAFRSWWGKYLEKEGWKTENGISNYWPVKNIYTHNHAKFCALNIQDAQDDNP